MTEKTHKSRRLEEQIELLYEINRKIDYAIELIREDYLHFPFHQTYCKNYYSPDNDMQ